MNILCLEQFADMGGGQRSLIDLLPAMARQGWQVQVAAPDGAFLSGVGQLNVRANILHCHTYLNGYKPARDLARYMCELPEMIQAIRRIVRAQAIDVLYVNGPRVLPAAAIVGRLYAIPVVFHSHNRISQAMAVSTVGRALKLSNARMVACCNYAAEPLRQYLHGEQVFIVYNGVAGTTSVRRKMVKRRRRIGVIGRIEREKGQMEFVLAAQSVARWWPDCTFVLAGAPLFATSSYLNQVVEASRGLPIEFLGWREDISSVLAGLDLLVVPSGPLDSAPRVIAEAFAAGVPVVAAPSGGIPEIITDGATGLLAARQTPDALANTIAHALTMPPERMTDVVDRARKAWRDRFTLEAYQHRVIDILQSASRERCRRRIHLNPCTIDEKKVHA